MTSFLGFRFALLSAVTWIIYFALSYGIKQWFRSLKDPADYNGNCYKSNGYRVDCSLDHWLTWDATPYIDIYHFVGGIAAAAITGYLYIRFLGNGRNARM